jgi:uncharacterized membrane protein
MFVSIESKLQKRSILASFLSRLSVSLFSWVVSGILAVAASNAWGLVVSVAKAFRASGFIGSSCWR